MYPKKCLNSLAFGHIKIKTASGTTLIEKMTLVTYHEDAYVKLPSLAKGTYSIMVKVDWLKNMVKDYTVDVYAPIQCSFEGFTQG